MTGFRPVASERGESRNQDATGDVQLWRFVFRRSIVFWVGVALIGLAYPFVVHAYAIGRGRHSLASGIGSGVGLTVAGLLLRYLIVAAGIPAVL